MGGYKHLMMTFTRAFLLQQYIHLLKFKPRHTHYRAVQTVLTDFNEAYRQYKHHVDKLRGQATTPTLILANHYRADVQNVFVNRSRVKNMQMTIRRLTDEK